MAIIETVLLITGVLFWAGIAVCALWAWSRRASRKLREEERVEDLRRLLAQPDARSGIRQGILIPDDDVAWESFQQEMTRPNPRGDLR